MKKALRIASVAVTGIVVCVGVWGVLSYVAWSARGDVVAFSPTGGLGWGSRPYFIWDTRKQHHRVGTIHSYLFLGDAQVDTSALDKVYWAHYQ